MGLRDLIVSVLGVEHRRCANPQCPEPCGTGFAQSPARCHGNRRAVRRAADHRGDRGAGQRRSRCAPLAARQRTGDLLT